MAVDVDLGTDTAVKFATRRVGHANLFVAELARSMQFYGGVAGFEEVFTEPAIIAGFLSNGNTHHDLGLIQCREGDIIGKGGRRHTSSGRAMQPGLNHLGWETENEKLLVEAYDRAVAAGVNIRGCTDHQSSHSIYTFDPDGFVHEYYADMLPDWRSFFNNSAGSLISGTWDPHAGTPTTKMAYPVDPEIRPAQGALIPSQRFTHAVFVTRQHEAMVAFHRDVAGLRVVHESKAGDFICLAGSHTNFACDLVLFKGEPDRAASVHHYSYQLASEPELDAAERAIEKARIVIEKRIDCALKRSFFIPDPDGIRCEFYVARAPEFGFVEEAEPALRPYLV